MSFTRFNKSFFKEFKDIEVFDEKAILRLDDNTLIKFVINNSLTKNEYDSYIVYIIKKNIGVIDKSTFYFAEHFNQKDRIDNMIDRYKKNKFFVEFKSDKGEYDWYIATPSRTAITRMIKQILKYTEFFK